MKRARIITAWQDRIDQDARSARWTPWMAILAFPCGIAFLWAAWTWQLPWITNVHPTNIFDILKRFGLNI